MKKQITIITIVTLFLFLISCNNDNCDNNSNYLSQVESENTNWRAADSAYNASMTVENCEELNRITLLYVESLMSLSDCISEAEKDQYNNQVIFLEASVIEDCN